MLAASATVPLYLFSGIFYPIATLPPPMQWLSYANPLTYGVDLIRFSLLGVHEIPIAWSALMLAILAAASVFVAVSQLFLASGCSQVIHMERGDVASQDELKNVTIRTRTGELFYFDSAVVFGNHVTHVDTDAKPHPPIFGQIGIAFR